MKWEEIQPGQRLNHRAFPFTYDLLVVDKFEKTADTARRISWRWANDDEQYLYRRWNQVMKNCITILLLEQ